MSSSAVKEVSRSPLVRLLVLAPPLLSSGASALLLAVSPLTWGVAREVALASWATTGSALVVGLPAFLTAVYGIRGSLRRTQGLFEVDLFSALLGAGAHWAAAVSLIVFAGTMTSAASYRSLGAEGASSAGFFFLAIVASVVGNFLLLGLTVVYVNSITPGRKTRAHERAGDEVDFVEQWAQRRPSRSRPARGRE